VAWVSYWASKDWQTGVIIPINKKGYRSECTKWQGISLLNLFGKLYERCLEEKCGEIIELKLVYTQRGFCPGRSTTEQIFTLQKIWEIVRECQRCPHMFCRRRECIRTGISWKSLGSVDGCLSISVKSLYSFPVVCVSVGKIKSQPIAVCAGLRQGCVLSPLLFIAYMNWIDSPGWLDECVAVGRCRINRLFCANNLVLLASSQQDLQHAFDRFSPVCGQAEMKIRTKNTEV